MHSPDRPFEGDIRQKVSILSNFDQTSYMYVCIALQLSISLLERGFHKENTFKPDVFQLDQGWMQGEDGQFWSHSLGLLL